MVCVLMNIVIVLMKQETSFEASKNGEKNFLHFFFFFVDEIIIYKM